LTATWLLAVWPKPGFFVDPKPGEQLDTLRQAIAGQWFTDLEYEDAAARTTQRQVRPLGLYFWGDVWTLAAWCELRQDFRNFRLDRVVDARIAPAAVA